MLCISKKSQTIADCMWKYEFDEKSKSRKNFKNPFLHDGFSTNLVHKWVFKSRPDFLDFLQILTKCFKDYFVLVGRHTIFHYFLVKSDFCSLRHLGYTVLKRMTRISKFPLKSRKRAHTVLCTYYIQNWTYYICRKCFN